MCVSIFAGCANGPAEDANLISAKDYLFALYKDNNPKTAADFTVYSKVMVGDVAYPITWTADAGDNVKIIPGETMTTIDINEETETEIKYTLTATLTNEAGETASVSFNYTIPAKATTSEGGATLYFPADQKYITGKEYAYTSSSGTTKMELILSDSKADAVALTVQENDDNTVSFIAEGKYLFCDGTNVNFTATADDNTKFVLEPAAGDNQYFIKCAVANYNGKAQYLEVYSGYLTCYGMNADKADIYTFELSDTTGANGKLEAAGTTPPVTEPTQPTTPTTQPTTAPTTAPTTKPTTPAPSVQGKLAASLDMLGTTTRVSRTDNQTVHAANGITYTNDKASSTTNNYDQQKNYSTRAYKSSTIKIEYTGMVKIVFTLDDFNNGDYLDGFDGMEVSGATITRDNDVVTITFASATNVFQSAELLHQVRIEKIDVYTA